MTLLSDGVEEIGLDYGLGFAIVNLVWGGGQVLGAICSGALAATTSDTAAYLLLAGICTATLLTVAPPARPARGVDAGSVRSRGAARYTSLAWGYSSAGRASRWQREGRRFEPD